jgi:hypothetical protein
MDKMTHDGRIGTDEIMSPGYVWYRCNAYTLPDNTMGKIGYHVIYRPLCRDMKEKYQGHEVVTDQMMIDAREHYAIIAEKERIAEISRREREIESIKNIPPPSAFERMLCPRCGTVCYGDCRS